MRYIYTSPPARVVAPCRRMNDGGIDPDHIGQAAFAARIGSDAARYERVIRRTGIRVEP
jgi:hypothetical protein